VRAGMQPKWGLDKGFQVGRFIDGIELLFEFLRRIVG
jgi:hypothetical protein